mmetsp:Transcript_21744/g.64802  ORF Transcript_21744/g.64802 Transcript_21744/m.64802 type:complete len:405 (+) Transcript_21744:3997-5211(+)
MRPRGPHREHAVPAVGVDVAREVVARHGLLQLVLARFAAVSRRHLHEALAVRLAASARLAAQRPLGPLRQLAVLRFLLDLDLRLGLAGGHLAQASRAGQAATYAWELHVAISGALLGRLRAVGPRAPRRQHAVLLHRAHVAGNLVVAGPHLLQHSRRAALAAKAAAILRLAQDGAQADLLAAMARLGATAPPHPLGQLAVHRGVARSTRLRHEQLALARCSAIGSRAFHAALAGPLQRRVTALAPVVPGAELAVHRFVLRNGLAVHRFLGVADAGLPAAAVGRELPGPSAQAGDSVVGPLAPLVPDAVHRLALLVLVAAPRVVGAVGRLHLIANADILRGTGVQTAAVLVACHREPILLGGSTRQGDNQGETGPQAAQAAPAGHPRLQPSRGRDPSPNPPLGPG